MGRAATLACSNSKSKPPSRVLKASKYVTLLILKSRNALGIDIKLLPILDSQLQTSMAYVKLTTESELPGDGEAKEFELGDKVICVANVNGAMCAMDNICLHMGGPLGQGFIDGNKIVCPWHGWEYDL
jgi:Rieske Fe-S protein